MKEEEWEKKKTEERRGEKKRRRDAWMRTKEREREKKVFDFFNHFWMKGTFVQKVDCLTKTIKILIPAKNNKLP